MTNVNQPTRNEIPRLREALERVRPAMEQLAATDLLPINLDPLAAAATVSGALAGLLAIRNDIDAIFKDFDFSCLDELESYTLALIQAETVYRGTAMNPKKLADLARDGFTLRCRLIADVRALVKRGLLSAPRLAKLTGPNGYHATATDLLTLATFLREHWQLIEHNSPIRFEEVDRAESLGDQLIHAIGARDKSSPRWVQSAEQRARAYTLLVRAYDELRYAVEYLRRHQGDAEKIAPSLHKKRKSQCKKPNTDDVAQSIEESAPKNIQSKSVDQFNDDPFVH